jgi:hypothetical protein
MGRSAQRCRYGRVRAQKEKSAIDSAIRDAKEELKTSEAKIIVTSLEGRKLGAVWKGP